MADYDWSRFSQKIYLNTRMQHVYDAWTKRANIEHWFLRKGEFTNPNGKVREDNEQVQKGDKYEWMWHGHPDTTAEHGVITEANGKDHFQFVFGDAGVVTVDMKEVGNATELVLTQDRIPTDEKGRVSYHIGCSTGWTFYLANLKSLMEGGIDLRNKNVDYKGVINS